MYLLVKYPFAPSVSRQRFVVMQGRCMESVRSRLRTIDRSLDTIVNTLVATMERIAIASPFVIQEVQSLQTLIELEV